MPRPVRASIKVEGLEHLREMLMGGKLLSPAWRHLMQRGQAHMLDAAKARAPMGRTGKLAAGFTTKLHPGVNPFWGVIKNTASNGGDLYPLYLNRGRRKGTPYKLRSGKRARGWLSNVVRLRSVKSHIDALVEAVKREVEAKWRT